MSSKFTSLFFSIIVFDCGRGYPGGAPDMSCQSLMPTGHGAGPQMTPPPFKIFVSKMTYKPGETLQGEY